MFPFWNLAIAPVLDAISARAVVEIGSLRGETTTLLLEHLGLNTRLDVIDPLPQFDPTEHERRFPGRYRFHRDISMQVLPDLPAVDAALIDGDHNWYTVYNELKLLAATALTAQRPLPVVIMHDVCWPYGRRDLYYEPALIPEEYRQPHAQRGIRRGCSELLRTGGMNAQLHNALHEGGPRNGVATALDDFLSEYGRRVRKVILPVYFGLAIVADEWRLAREPRLVAHLDWLESAAGQHELVELSEDLYASAVTSQHNATFGARARLGRSVDRYLELLAAALLDEHYVENEVRNHYLLNCARKGREPDPRVLRDPERFIPAEMSRLRALRQKGRLPTDGNDRRPYFPYTTMGRTRLGHLHDCLEAIRLENVAGDLVESGTGRGGAGIYMRGYVEAHELTDRQVWIVDRFGAPPLPTWVLQPVSADLNAVRDGFDRFDLLDERVRFLQGPVAETLSEPPMEAVALVRIGDTGDGFAGDVLEQIYDKLVVGGFVIVEDYAADTTKAAVDAFRERRAVPEPVTRVDAASVSWRKFAHATGGQDSATVSARHTPRALPSRSGISLSVVVVVFDMRREAERTLHSLSRAYQEGIADLDYEVLVVENGSAPDQELGGDLVQGFGREFRYISLGDAATPSPVHAMNLGIAEASGNAFALMIDGAHALTPGVLRYGTIGLELYRPAVVATQQWYVGPGQQPETVASGFDRAAQNRLFDEIGWPSRGYELFDIGHFIGDRDWFDPISESNCLFVQRSALEQAGAFDEAFAAAGGGLANLDLFERLASAPGVTLASILGEGSFHQAHGGTTTNVPDPKERRARIDGYYADYVSTRGKAFRRPAKPMHYVGHVAGGATRTRARRRIAPTLWRLGQDQDRDGIPDAPVQLPDDLALDYTLAYWRSLSWRETRWLGTHVDTPPPDLLAYQELIVRLGPDWVVATRAHDGGLTAFLASICDLVGHGMVLSVGPGQEKTHPRVKRLSGEPTDAQVVRDTHSAVGESASALVVLGSRRSAALTLAEFTAYSPLVPPGGYVVVENTVVGGHPVWPSFGPGPAEAVRTILADASEFTADLSIEPPGLTFNRRGYLRRSDDHQSASISASTRQSSRLR